MSGGSKNLKFPHCEFASLLKVVHTNGQKKVLFRNWSIEVIAAGSRVAHFSVTCPIVRPSILVGKWSERRITADFLLTMVTTDE